MDRNELAFVAIVSLVALAVLIFVAYRILRNPFRYPNYTHTFDVSRKRNVDIADYVDRFLCNRANWQEVKWHATQIERWKTEQEQYLQTCALKGRRTRQYREALDDERAFRFITVRDQTRYRQRNYVKTSYKVSVADSELDVSWGWLVDRHERLARIGFEATLKEYHSKSQRKLMTKALRKQIMERDHYTCQICGKYMPDEVGLQIDHIIPVAKGGKTVPSNLRVLCNRCNGRKGAR
ncbi:HNH endonuclease [Olsenella uli]|uniref:HNH endonuclease n=1 Tax=Olsenella uli TaxID=133926 RepID=UPI0019578BD8|nr:HNH endonuclease [Olsenella uli]MBM6675717.1 HNH endonuclease [Olsenella uli]